MCDFEGVAWYWHFVNIVWLFLFVSNIIGEVTKCAPILEELLPDLVAGGRLLLALHCNPDHVGTRVCALLHLQVQT
jgi:hypothetical protein